MKNKKEPFQWYKIQSTSKLSPIFLYVHVAQKVRFQINIPIEYEFVCVLFDNKLNKQYTQLALWNAYAPNAMKLVTCSTQTHHTHLKMYLPNCQCVL